MPTTNDILLIKRDLFRELKDHLKQKEISFIVGPRQAGKTTLMLALEKFLKKTKKATLYFNLDIEDDNQYFTSQAKLIDKIKQEIGSRGGYVFIDEIQRKENAGIFLKGIYDMRVPYKFIVSGSGSVELKEKVHESLVGRKRLFQLSTISFSEFINFRTDYKYKGKLVKYLSFETQKANSLLVEYLKYGGYPRVILAETDREKKAIIAELYQSYLIKDISLLLNVKKLSSFSDLVKILANQSGRLVNLSELSSTLGLSVQTVKEYLWYLEKTFVIKKVTPFFRNTRKEITKSPIYYFYDLGMRNYAAGCYALPLRPSDAGFLFQNLVMNIIEEGVKFSPGDIHYWRTKDGAEVDFVVKKGSGIVPVEVKYKELKKVIVARSLRSFINNYSPKTALVVNLHLEKTHYINKSKVEFIPIYKLLGNVI